MSRHSPKAGTADWLLDAVKSNPEGLLFLAAGCALLLRSGGALPASRSGRAASGSESEADARPAAAARDWGVAENLSQAADSARAYATEMNEKITGAARSYASAASDYADEARRTMADQSGRVLRDTQQTLQQTFSRMLQDQPLAVAAAGLAAGAAVAAAFPATEIERRTLGAAGERFKDVAAERLKDATTRAGEKFMSAADERGLNKDGLRDLTRDVAGAFGSALSGEPSGARSNQGGQGPDWTAGPSGGGSPMPGGGRSDREPSDSSSGERGPR
jgi:hypothetical protein